MQLLVDELHAHLTVAKSEGSKASIERARKRKKFLARERIQLLLDKDSPFIELMPLAGLLHEGGFGPGGTMILVDCLTDNANRTIGEVRPAFTKGKGKFGTPGTVAHMFEHAAVFVFKGDEDAVLECLLMADVDVLEVESDDELVTVMAPITEFAKARTTLTGEYPEIDFEVDELQFVPKGETLIEGEDLEQFEKLLGLLNNCEDVQNIYHDAKYG